MMGKDKNENKTTISHEARVIPPSIGVSSTTTNGKGNTSVSVSGGATHNPMSGQSSINSSVSGTIRHSNGHATSVGVGTTHHVQSRSQTGSGSVYHHVPHRGGGQSSIGIEHHRGPRGHHRTELHIRSRL